MSSHSPEERNAMTGDRNVRVITAGHEDCVTIAHDRHQLRIFSIVVNQLYAKCRIRHVEKNVNLFQHCGVFVRWPTRPIAGFRIGESGYQSARLNVLSEQHSHVTLTSGSAGFETETWVCFKIGIANDLHGIALG